MITKTTKHDQNNLLQLQVINIKRVFQADSKQVDDNDEFSSPL